MSTYSSPGYDYGEEYEFGLDLILHGLEELLVSNNLRQHAIRPSLKGQKRAAAIRMSEALLTPKWLRQWLQEPTRTDPS